MKKSHQIIIQKCTSENPKDHPTFSELYRKLSLSSDDSILGFDGQIEKDVIDYEEEESNEDDDDEINKKFCLDSVDLNEIFCYIDEMNKEPNSYNDDDGKNEEIENITKTIIDMKKTMEEQSSTISDLMKTIKDKDKQIIKNTNDFNCF